MTDQIDHDSTAPNGAQPMTRRQALKAAGTGLALLLPMAARCAFAADQWVDVGPAAKFVSGTPSRVTTPSGGVLYVTRQTADTLVAFSAKCTHRGCEVPWSDTDKQFECPCHGAAFTATGKNIHGTRRNPQELLPALESVPARQSAGTVQVNLAGIPDADLHPVGT